MWSTQLMICCLMALLVVSHSRKMRRAAVWLRTMNAVLAAEVPAGTLGVEPGLTGVTHGTW
jgi:hypothetical protein